MPNGLFEEVVHCKLPRSIDNKVPDEVDGIHIGISIGIDSDIQENDESQKLTHEEEAKHKEAFWLNELKCNRNNNQVVKAALNNCNQCRAKIPENITKCISCGEHI